MALLGMKEIQLLHPLAEGHNELYIQPGIHRGRFLKHAKQANTRQLWEVFEEFCVTGVPGLFLSEIQLNKNVFDLRPVC